MNTDAKRSIVMALGVTDAELEVMSIAELRRIADAAQLALDQTVSGSPLRGELLVTRARVLRAQCTRLEVDGVC